MPAKKKEGTKPWHKGKGKGKNDTQAASEEQPAAVTETPVAPEAPKEQPVRVFLGGLAKNTTGKATGQMMKGSTSIQTSVDGSETQLLVQPEPAKIDELEKATTTTNKSGKRKGGKIEKPVKFNVGYEKPSGAVQGYYDSRGNYRTRYIGFTDAQLKTMGVSWAQDPPPAPPKPAEPGLWEHIKENPGISIAAGAIGGLLGGAVATNAGAAVLPPELRFPVSAAAVGVGAFAAMEIEYGIHEAGRSVGRKVDAIEQKVSDVTESKWLPWNWF